VVRVAEVGAEPNVHHGRYASPAWPMRLRATDRRLLL
jgi:hypothetical protein